MSLRATWLCRILFVGLATALPAASAAQGLPRIELSAGWRLLHATDVNEQFDETLAAGWYADVAWNVTNAIALVGDVAGAYKTFEEAITELGARVDVTAEVDVHTFLGGVRVSARQLPRVVPFGQVLFGVAHGKVDVEGSATIPSTIPRLPPVTIRIDESESSNEFALEAGGGVTLNLIEAVGIRIAGSYMRIGTEDGSNAFRFGVGAVLGF